MLNAKLVVVGGGDAKVTEIQLALPTTIGRSREAKVKLPHPLVSRQHCELFEREGQLFVRDLGSLNGTYVDSQKIDSEQALEPNHLLTLGTVTFRAIYEVSIGNGDVPLSEQVATDAAPTSERPTDPAEPAPASKPARRVLPPSEIETENAAGDTDSELPAINPPDMFETVSPEEIASSGSSSIFNSESPPSSNGSAAARGIVGLPVAAPLAQTESDNADVGEAEDSSGKRRPR